MTVLFATIFPSISKMTLVSTPFVYSTWLEYILMFHCGWFQHDNKDIELNDLFQRAQKALWIPGIRGKRLDLFGMSETKTATYYTESLKLLHRFKAKTGQWRKWESSVWLDMASYRTFRQQENINKTKQKKTWLMIFWTSFAFFNPSDTDCFQLKNRLLWLTRLQRLRIWVQSTFDKLTLCGCVAYKSEAIT